MRRISFVLGLSAALALAACGDRGAQAPTEPQVSAPSFSTQTACTGDYNSISNLLKQLFGSTGASINSALGKLNNLQKQLGKGNTSGAQAQAINLIGYIYTQYYAKQLSGPAPTPANVASVVSQILCYAGLPAPPSTGVVDAAQQVLTPTSPTTDIITDTKWSGVEVPAGAIPTGLPTGGVLVSITRLPDLPSPLLTSLDRYPAYYQYTTTPELPNGFALPVTIAICQYSATNLPGNPSTPYPGVLTGPLQLAHNTGTGFGQVEILPPATVPFTLNCGGLTQLSRAGSPGGAGFAQYALAGLRAFSRVAAEALLPEKAFAVVGCSTCSGAGTGKFSPFGAVDPTSNPGSLTINSPAGGIVTGTSPTTVKVKVTSQGLGSSGDYAIPNVPITFTQGANPVCNAVLTGPDGIAPCTWRPTPGATLVATAPMSPASGPQACLGQASLTGCVVPAVQFSPQSVTFITPDLLPPSFGSSWTYYQVPNAGSEPSGWQTLALPASSPWQTGPAAFGYQTYCALAVGTPWTTSTLMLLRKDVYVPSGVTSATISVLIDNDVQVWVNGFDVSGGLNTHEGCANTSPPGPFTFNASSAAPTLTVPLQAGAVNKIAVLGVDRGDQTYLDVQMTLHTP